VRTLWGMIALAALAACSTEKREERATDTGTSAAGTVANADPDRSTGGSGVPAGYVGLTDPARANRPQANIADAKYAANGGRWEVTTGPAHIVYAAKDSARGNYTASATFDQLEAPTHPEAFGIFVGGKDLDKPTQSYTYLLVRGTGDVLVKQRNGDQTKDVVAWKASDAVPKQDAAGKATYRLAVKVAGDSVHFLVNDKSVAVVKKGTVPTDGIAGLRINHNLHVATTPVTITKS
jgi:hypothetical protein